MVVSRHVECVYRPKEKIRLSHAHQRTNTLVIAEGHSTLIIFDVLEMRLNQRLRIEFESTIASLLCTEEHIWCGFEDGDVKGFNHRGELTFSFKIEAGIGCLRWYNQTLYVLDGMGVLHACLNDGNSFWSSLECGLEDVNSCSSSKDSLLVVGEDGSCQLIRSSQTVWSRPSRGIHGERISHGSVCSDGSLLICREAAAFSDGEEEVIELEHWNEGALLSRFELSKRVLTSFQMNKTLLLGCDNGDVLTFEDGLVEIVLSTNHPIQTLASFDNHILAGSWFYLNGISNGIHWKVEHQGFVEQVFVFESLQLLIFLGQDQNDFTEPEPIGALVLHDNLIELDESELSLWFEAENVVYGHGVDELYEDTQHQEMLSFLSEEERLQFQATDVHHQPMTGLMKALLDTQETSDIDVELNSVEIENELLNELTAPVEQYEIPQADAGHDQTHVIGKADSIVVILDGHSTYDPDQRISHWQWFDQRGREIATQPVVKVKLPVGTHTFVLRVRNVDDITTTDSVHIHVLEGSTS